VRGAFSLIEILVVIALLSVIIIGLVMMFSQTQRAYRLGTTQVDVLEGGRAITDMMTRELSQMTPSRVSNCVNFYVQIAPFPPVKQLLPGNPAPGRTNLIEELFFLTEENKTWKGIGYRVSNLNGGIGSLYRYERTNSFNQDPALIFSNYFNTVFLSKPLLDGVVHFKVLAYDTNGNWIATNNLPFAFVREPQFSGYAGGEVESYLFMNKLVPASVEIQLGILEERAFERAKSISDATTRSNFVAQQAGKVHLFRWRVPVRNVDPTAYQ